MNIYFVKRKSHTPSGETSCMIVAAPSAHAAKRVHPEDPGLSWVENQWVFRAKDGNVPMLEEGSWPSPQELTAQLLRKDHPSAPHGKVITTWIEL